jgi:endonuclease YncB( thermonuclease family)
MTSAQVGIPLHNLVHSEVREQPARRWKRGIQQGNKATKIAKQFQGSKVQCELTGAKSYDRLVGYCSIDGSDFGLFMMQNSSCKVWEKYDVWDRY